LRFTLSIDVDIINACRDVFDIKLPSVQLSHRFDDYWSLLLSTRVDDSCWYCDTVRNACLTL